MHGWSARLRQSAQPQKVSLVYYAQVTTSQQALQVVPGRQGTYKTQQALQTCTMRWFRSTDFRGILLAEVTTDTHRARLFDCAIDLNRLDRLLLVDLASRDDDLNVI